MRSSETCEICSNSKHNNSAISKGKYNRNNLNKNLIPKTFDFEDTDLIVYRERNTYFRIIMTNPIILFFGTESNYYRKYKVFLVTTSFFVRILHTIVFLKSSINQNSYHRKSVVA